MTAVKAGYLAATVTSTATSATFTCGITDAKEGDILVAYAYATATFNSSTPSGWTVIYQASGTQFCAFYKISDGTETTVSITANASKTYRMATATIRSIWRNPTLLDSDSNSGSPPSGLTLSTDTGDNIIFGVATVGSSLTLPAGWTAVNSSTNTSSGFLGMHGDASTSGPHAFGGSGTIAQYMWVFAQSHKRSEYGTSGTANAPSSAPGGGTHAWSNVASVYTASTTDYASTAASASIGWTQGIDCTDFGFTVPAGYLPSALGLDLSLNNTYTTNIQDSTIQWRHSGSLVGNNGTTGGNIPNSTQTTVLYGYTASPSNWGVSMTEAMVESSTFGLGMQFYYSQASTSQVRMYEAIPAVGYTYHTELTSTCVNPSTLSGTLSAPANLSTNAVNKSAVSSTISAPCSLSSTFVNKQVFEGFPAWVFDPSVIVQPQVIPDGLSAPCSLSSTFSNAQATTLDTIQIDIRPTVSTDYPIYLAEIAGQSGTTYRFCTGEGYNDGSGHFYQPRIVQPATFGRSIGGQVAGFGGRGQASRGECTIANPDRALDAMMSDYFDGRLFRLLVGTRDTAYVNFTVAMQCTIEGVGFERKMVSIRLRDDAVTLDKPFSDVKYAGTDDAILPLGVEGTAEGGIKGTYKPRVFGRISMMAPTYVNASSLIYQVSDKQLPGGVVNVFDGGSYLSHSSPDYASLVALQAIGGAPAAGSFKVYNGSEGCYFRLGSSPWGSVTACVVEDWDYLDISTSGVVEKILIEKGYVAGTDYVANDFTALDQSCAAPIGVLVQEAETTAALLDRICANSGCYWGHDSLNRIRVARLEAPDALNSVLTITDDIIIDGDRQPDQAQALWQHTVKSDKNYATLNRSGLTGVATATTDRAQWLMTETRDQVSADAAIKTDRLLADVAIDEQALWASPSQAKAEAARRLTLYGTRRDTVQLTIGRAWQYVGVVDIGKTVLLNSTRLGYSVARPMVVVGVWYDLRKGVAEVMLWG